jgi:hypothetical protein
MTIKLNFLNIKYLKAKNNGTRLNVIILLTHPMQQRFINRILPSGAGRTTEQYYQDNKEQTDEHHRQYHSDNKEEINRKKEIKKYLPMIGSRMRWKIYIPVNKSTREESPNLFQKPTTN